jgi:hypothetical protein
VDNLFTTPQQSVVQWTATPQEPSKWDWADELGNYEVLDSTGKRYKPNGVAARVVNANGGNMLLARYDPARTLTSVPASNDMKVTEVTLYWVVPSKSTIRALQYKQDPVQSMNLAMP